MVKPAAFKDQRKKMVHEQIFLRGIRDERVLRAMLEVPRHLFVPKKLQNRAYHDGALQIAKQQTISQPYIVARMSELLRLGGGETVLEIGTGSGYQAAILSKLAGKVYTLELHQQLADGAAEILARLGIQNVRVICADGSCGWPQAAPYDAILVAAAAPKVAAPWLEQLKDGGRLTLPVGGPQGQYLQYWERQGNRYDHEDIVSVSFVPLRGKYGWKKGEWDRDTK